MKEKALVDDLRVVGGEYTSEYLLSQVAGRYQRLLGSWPKAPGADSSSLLAKTQQFKHQ